MIRSSIAVHRENASQNQNCVMVLTTVQMAKMKCWIVAVSDMFSPFFNLLTFKAFLSLA